MTAVELVLEAKKLNEDERKNIISALVRTLPECDPDNPADADIIDACEKWNDFWAE